MSRSPKKPWRRARPLPTWLRVPLGMAVLGVYWPLTKWVFKKQWPRFASRTMTRLLSRLPPSFSPAAHDEMVRAADAAGAARLILIGPESTAAAARVAPSTPTACYPDSSAAAEAEGGLELGARDVVLIKGSRGIRTERLLDALAGSFVSSH